MLDYPFAQFQSLRVCVQLLQSCPTLCNPMDCSPLGLHRSLCPWDSPGKNTGVDCHVFSRRSSQPRDRTWVSLQADSLLLSKTYMPPANLLHHSDAVSDSWVKCPSLFSPNLSWLLEVLSFSSLSLFLPQINTLSKLRLFPVLYDPFFLFCPGAHRHIPNMELEEPAYLTSSYLKECVRVISFEPLPWHLKFS